MKENVKSGRMLSYDCMRIFAILSVVMVHISAYVVIKYPNPNGSEFIVGNIFNGLARAGVPLFLMLSGALLLDEKRSFDAKKFYKKTLSAMTVLTVGWMIFYGLLYAYILPRITGEPAAEGAFADFLLTFKGADCPHLWYMLMIVGMYSMIPVLRLFVKRQNKNYIIGIIAVSVFVQFICRLLDLTVRESAVNFTVFIGKLHLEPVTGYIVYILSGWYLANNSIGRKGRLALYIAAVAAVAASILAVQYCISDISDIRDYCYEALTLTAFLYGCAMFVLVKFLCGGRKTNRAAALLSDMSFG
ncbi:MAG: acyltransferase, partial [Candidatus Ornithomonoglobus sp.]